MTTVCFITGAARGFGRALALQCAALIPGRVAFVLVSRDREQLAATQSMVLSAGGSRVLVATVSADLGDIDELDAVWDTCERAVVHLLVDGQPPIAAVFFNNAGSLGDIGYVHQMTSARALRAAMDVNVTAALWLSARFEQWTRSSRGPRRAPQHAGHGGTTAAVEPAATAAAPACWSTIVNVSSLAAVQPMESLATYCAGKAARDMFHAVMAVEQPHCTPPTGAPPLRTLNYAPGPLATDMNRSLQEAEQLHGPSKQFFRELVTSGGIVDPAVSAQKCVRLVLRNEFVSGAHVDYYDIAVVAAAST